MSAQISHLPKYSVLSVPLTISGNVFQMALLSFMISSTSVFVNSGNIINCMHATIIAVTPAISASFTFSLLCWDCVARDCSAVTLGLACESWLCILHIILLAVT